MHEGDGIEGCLESVEEMTGVEEHNVSDRGVSGAGFRVQGLGQRLDSVVAGRGFLAIDAAGVGNDTSQKCL